MFFLDQSRRCPLCAQNVGEYLIHNIRSKYDFQKHFLTPLRTSPNPQPIQPYIVPRIQRAGRNSNRPEREWGRTERRERERQLEAIDATERAVEKRKWIYRHRLYAKVCLGTSRAFRYLPLLIIAPLILACRLQSIHPLQTVPHSSSIRC